uniref:Uncharacterized protein n=1 Tax=Anguilla anguilla TaxID=7936 RepID=A0A0E9QZA1_ANGAN
MEAQELTAGFSHDSSLKAARPHSTSHLHQIHQNVRTTKDTVHPSFPFEAPPNQ